MPETLSASTTGVSWLSGGSWFTSVLMHSPNFERSRFTSCLDRLICFWLFLHHLLFNGFAYFWAFPLYLLDECFYSQGRFWIIVRVGIGISWLLCSCDNSHGVLVPQDLHGLVQRQQRVIEVELAFLGNAVFCSYQLCELPDRRRRGFVDNDAHQIVQAATRNRALQVQLHSDNGSTLRHVSIVHLSLARTVLSQCTVTIFSCFLGVESMQD